MTTIRVIYHGTPPNFPATDQHPDAVRYGPYTIAGIPGYWADCIGGAPTIAELAKMLAPGVPSIMRAQALLWLLTIGKTDKDIETEIGKFTDVKARNAALIEWRYRDTFHRGHPLINSIGTAFGLDSAQLDAAFWAASEL